MTNSLTPFEIIGTLVLPKCREVVLLSELMIAALVHIGIQTILSFMAWFLEDEKKKRHMKSEKLKDATRFRKEKSKSQALLDTSS